jgi:hypothetical protein
MKKLIFVAAILQATIANAAELRCRTTWWWGQAYTRCVPWFSEQELYEQRQGATVNDLDRSTRGGTRRASQAACQAALEAGVWADVTMSYGCSE